MKYSAVEAENFKNFLSDMATPALYFELASYPLSLLLVLYLQLYIIETPYAYEITC